MRRILSFLLLLSMFIATISLTSCHGKVAMKEFSMPEDFDENKQYEITFWAKNENNPTQREIYKNAVEKFQSLYPNIKVTLRNFSDYNEIFKDVITNIPTKTTPNICITYPDHIATYMSGENTVVPLDALIANEKYGLGGSALKFDSTKLDEIVPEFLNEGKLWGQQYALPFMRSTEACYINKDFVEKLGYTLPDVLTWDFIFEVSEAALAKNADGTFILNGQKVLIPFIYKSTDNMMISMLKQKNAPYSTDEAEIQIFNDTTRELLYEIGRHGKSKAFSTFQISSYPGNYLNRGQCIFAIDSTAGATWMGPNAPLIDVPKSELVDFETVVMPIPQYDTQNPQMISQGPSICVFNKEDSGEVLASWLFAQFLLTNDTQIAYAQTEGYIPVTTKAQNAREYKDYLSREGEDNELYYDVKIKASKMLIENTQNTFTAPVFNGSTALRNAAGELIELTVSSATKNRVIDEAFLDLLFSRVSSLYKLDQIKTNFAKGNLGELPLFSKALIGSISFIWLGMGAYFVADAIKKRKNK